MIEMALSDMPPSAARGLGDARLHLKSAPMSFCRGRTPPEQFAAA